MASDKRKEGDSVLRCARCVLPSTYPLIEFAADGVCSVCRESERLRLWPEPRGEEALRDLVEPYRQREKYDCLVALSGGRDSTYVLHYVVSELKLRPLAVTCDNGFMPQETKEAIARTVRVLGADHLWVHHDFTRRTFRPFLLAWEKDPNPALIGFLCNGCQGAIKSAISKTARANDIRLIIGGGGDLVGQGGEPEASFAEVLMRGTARSSGSRLSLAYGTFGHLARNPAYLATPWLLWSFAREAYYRFWYKYGKELEVVGLFEFLAWDEMRVVRTIVEQLDWQKPEHWPTTWRADCQVHFLKEYLYRETLGFTKNDELLSGMVRAGMLGREEALQRLRHDNRLLPDEVLSAFLARHGVDLSRLQTALQKRRRQNGQDT